MLRVKEIMHFRYDLNGHTLAEEPLAAPFTILVEPSLVIITVNTVCIDLWRFK